MYKYKVLRLSKATIETDLNKMGENGWKVIFIENTGDGRYRVMFESTT